MSKVSKVVASGGLFGSFSSRMGAGKLSSMNVNMDRGRDDGGELFLVVLGRFGGRRGLN